MNRWNIPLWLEQEVKARDKVCIYCRTEFSDSDIKKRATWEHIINDESIITPDNIARCCNACNSSKGTKKLSDWLKSKYCEINNIKDTNISDIAKRALEIYDPETLVSLSTNLGTTVALKKNGHGTPILFVPGHTSSFNGNKAKQLAQICEKLGRPVILPAYYGYDGSQCEGVPTGGKGYIRHWISQFLDLLDHHCPKPVVLVGHSMGGIIMLQLARRRPEKMAGLIGIAAGFGVNGQARATEIYGDSRFMGLKNHEPLSFTPEGNAMAFAPESFTFTCPLRLQHGMADDVVSWHNAPNIASACTGNDVQVWLNKSGTHAMDDVHSLAWLQQHIQQIP